MASRTLAVIAEGRANSRRPRLDLRDPLADNSWLRPSQTATLLRTHWCRVVVVRRSRGPDRYRQSPRRWCVERGRGARRGREGEPCSVQRGADGSIALVDRIADDADSGCTMLPLVGLLRRRDERY